MQSHSFQATKFNLHRIVSDTPGQVVEGFKILPYFKKGQTQRVDHSKNVISTCNRPVFKLSSSNFTESSMSPRGQVVEGFTILPTLESISIKRIVCLCLSLSLSVCLSRCIRTVFKLRSSNFTGSSTTPRDRSWRDSRFYPTPDGSEIKG